MGNLLSYSGIVTKIHAMQAKLLTDDHFREIAQLRNVAEVVTYLKKLPAYAKAFETVDENTLHRGDVEKILIQSLYNDYSKLYRFSGLEHQRFLRLYLKRYEVDLINYCLRIVYNHYEEPFDLNHKKPFFDLLLPDLNRPSDHFQDHGRISRQSARHRILRSTENFTGIRAPRRSV